MSSAKIRFSVIGLNHGHIYDQTRTVLAGGADLVSFFAAEPDLAAAFADVFPGVKPARAIDEILDDESIHLVVSASIPNERAALGMRTMLSGKDFMSDKPGFTTLEQLAEVRRVQAETRRIYSVLYAERLTHPATVKAGELVQAGAIGRVVQTVNLAPHSIGNYDRPEWFYDRKKQGGIIADIGSHQIDQFLFFTGSTKAEIVSASTANYTRHEDPEFEDFGEVLLDGDKGKGYVRIDWLSPAALGTWGDGRLVVLGTEGYIEVRKNCDVTRNKNGNHLFLVNQTQNIYLDCADTVCPYGVQLVKDIVERTEKAMSQEHCFRVAELALKAQKIAESINDSANRTV